MKFEPAEVRLVAVENNSSPVTKRPIEETGNSYMTGPKCRNTKPLCVENFTMGEVKAGLDWVEDIKA